jgi:hypothetical protein
MENKRKDKVMVRVWITKEELEAIYKNDHTIVKIIKEIIERGDLIK